MDEVKTLITKVEELKNQRNFKIALELLENSISKESIKAAYELNDDTNAYTDAEQAKVGFVSVTSAIDLDKVIQNDELKL